MNSIKILDELNKQIEEAARKIGEHRRNLQLKQINIESSLGEFQEAKNEIIIAESDEETLTASSNAMRQKLNSFDGSAKDQAQELNTDMKTFFKNLGIKVSTEISADLQERIEMTLTFTENTEYYATFYYKPEVEEYECKFG